METPDSLDELIRRAFDLKESRIDAPALTNVKARHMLITQPAERRDIFSMLAYFLNLKIKLYHAAIVFFLVWLSVVLLDRDGNISAEEVSSQPYSGIAAVRNSTILSSCQTFVLKK